MDLSANSKTEADQILSNIQQKLQALFPVPTSNQQTAHSDPSSSNNHPSQSEQSPNNSPQGPSYTFKEQNKAKFMVSEAKVAKQVDLQQSTRERMHVKDLEASSYIRQFDAIPTPTKDPAASNRQGGASSGVLQRINRMEEFYVQTIKTLQNRVTSLQEQNEQLSQKNNEQAMKIHSLELEHRKLQTNYNEDVQRYIRQLEQKLIKKFGDEASQIYTTVEESKQLLKQELVKEKKTRMALEDHLEETRKQLKSLEGFYQNLMQNHKRLLKADIQKNQASLYHSRMTQEDISKPELLSVVDQRRVLSKSQVNPTSIGNSNIRKIDKVSVETSGMNMMNAGQSRVVRVSMEPPKSKNSRLKKKEKSFDTKLHDSQVKAKLRRH